MNLPSYQNCILDLRFWLGSFRDWSGNQNHGVPTGVHFQKRPDTHIIYGNDTANKVVVADSPELRVTEGTVVVYTNRLVQAEDNLDVVHFKGLDHPAIYFSSTANQIAVYDGTTTRTISGFEYPGKSFVAVTFADGEIPKAYLEGEYIDEFSGTIICNGTSTTDLYVGNQSSGLRSFNSGLKGQLMYNIPLTSAQIAELYLWTQGTTTPSYKKKNFYVPSNIDGNGSDLLVAYDMSITNQSLVDLSGNKLDGAVVNATQINTPSGKALKFFGSGNVTAANIVQGSSGSVVFTVTPDDISGLEYYVANADGSRRFAIAGAINDLRFSYNNEGGVTSASENNCLVPGRTLHVVAAWDTEDIAYLYVDGELALNSDVASMSAVQAFTVGSRNAGDYNTTAAVGAVKVLDRCLAQTEVSALYREYAGLPVFVDDLKDANQSVASESGAYLSNTEWRIHSGTWSISREGNGKCIECVTNGTMYQESKHAFGTWEFDLYKDLDSSNSDIIFIASLPNIVSKFGQDGYLFRFDNSERLYMGETTSGSLTVKSVTTPGYLDLQTWYTFKITRDYTGGVSVYVDGVLADTFTDNSFSNSKYFVMDLDSGDKIKNFKFYQGVI